MTEERRRYFRIDDTLGVSFRRLTPEEIASFAERAGQHGGNFDLASNFDNRIQTLLDACRIQNPVAAEILDLMNKKLNVVLRQLDVDSELLQSIAYELKQVNVSACGLAFSCGERFNRGDILQLDLLLKPADLHVVSMAEVVACEAVENDDSEQAEFFLRVNFVELNSNDQELLIQHVVKRQSKLLKDRRRSG